MIHSNIYQREVSDFRIKEDKKDVAPIATVKCEKCPIAFDNALMLKAHVATVHYNPIHKCEKCDFSSTMKSRVEAHFEEVHKRPWIIPNGEEEEEKTGKSNSDTDSADETPSKQDDNPDEPEPMDDTPAPEAVQKQESANDEMEAPRYEPCPCLVGQGQ